MEIVWDVALPPTANNYSICMKQTRFMTYKFQSQSRKSKICSVRVKHYSVYCITLAKERKREPVQFRLTPSPSYVSHYHELMSRVYPVNTSFETRKVKQPVHLFWRLYCQASQHSKHRTLNIDHIACCCSRFRDIWLPTCQEMEVRQKRIKYQVTSLDSIITLGIQTSLSPCATPQVRGWRRVTFQTKM